MDYSKDIQNLQDLVAQQAVDLAHLSDEVYAHQKEIAVLKDEVQRLKADLAQSKNQGEGDEGTAHSLHHDRPPHY